MSLTESEADRRKKRIRPTAEHMQRKVIPPAANAEIDAMAELNGADIAELVRLTTLFSNHMEL